MADNAQPCSCAIYTNLCCCGPKIGISVSQPTCQNLPDGSVVNNPAYSPQLNKSFWTYKFITDCDKATRAISNFVIPICEVINPDTMMVSEKIDGCGQFTPVPFTLSKTDPNFGPAPTGFQWVKVETNNRYSNGVSVEYRLEIIGDFPVSAQAIKVKAATAILVFDCTGCFLVPMCNPQGKLTLTKKCSQTIVNNQATIHYELHVGNIGNGALTNVSFTDTIFYPAGLTVGLITVTPASLTVDTTIPQQIKISGNLGTVNPGDDILIAYTVSIAAISAPGQYILNNTAKVAGTNTEANAGCSTNLNVVQVTAAKCCSTSGNKVVFTLTIANVGLSPDVVVDILDFLEIPPGITVQFSDFAGCFGFFTGTTTPVPLNTPVPGPVGVDITCKAAIVPKGGSYQKIGTLFVLSSSVIGSSPIINTITGVVPADPSAQVFLGASPIPVAATVNVDLTLACQKPC